VAPTQRNPAAADGSATAEDAADGPTLLDIITERLAGRGTPAHQVWLPPLADPPALAELTGPLATRPERGFGVVDAELIGRLRAPIALVDRPFEQRRDTLTLDLSGSEGHVAVIGAPQSGKSTMLRTLICALALTHTPAEVQFYCLDFSGGSLTALRTLPHLGGVAPRRDINHVRRTIAEVVEVLNHREQVFIQRGIDSMATFRRLRKAGELRDERHGDVFLVIDGWLTLRNEFDDLEERVVDLANRGLSYGIHVVTASSRWLDLRGPVRDVFGTRLELRLGDPSDSSIDRRAAANVPEKTPGRGITPDGHQSLVALPLLDPAAGIDDLAQGTQSLVNTIRTAWSGPVAPPVRLLPDRVAYRDLPQLPDQAGIAVGLAESDLQPVLIDPTAGDPHMIIFGENECGKSALLRAFARAISDRYRPDQAKILVVDYRRSLLGGLPDSHLLGYGTSADVSAALLQDAAVVMRERLPGPDVTAEQLRARNWWRGPDLYVLVDDYDLVASDRNPLMVLHEFLAQSREIGLHLVIARRSGGASRAFYDPVLGRLRDLATPGIVMSGDREDGPLLGNVRLGSLPPGRGWLVTRREGARLIQCGWLDPADAG
jgi:DNA segregation ATPase FtsK/SpoIIIE, S-DNA-T family